MKNKGPKIHIEGQNINAQYDEKTNTVTIKSSNVRCEVCKRKLEKYSSKIDATGIGYSYIDDEIDLKLSLRDSFKSNLILCDKCKDELKKKSDKLIKGFMTKRYVG